MFAGPDDLFASLAGLVSTVFNAQGIDIKLREIIILRAAHLLNAPYETTSLTWRRHLKSRVTSTRRKGGLTKRLRSFTGFSACHGAAAPHLCRAC